MTYLHDISAEFRLIYLRLMGRVSESELIAAIKSMYADPAFRSEYDLVWDSRYISELLLLPDDLNSILENAIRDQPHPTPDRIVTLVKGHASCIFTSWYQAVVRRDGKEMEIFSSIDAAVKWLGLSEEAMAWLKSARGVARPR